MADKKISALTSATTPLAGTEVLPVVQGASTVKVAVSDLTAGRAVSATSLTASTGNVVIGASGSGVDFSASPHTAGMTSELLNDYEEGTWTPNQGAGLTVVGTFSSSGTYTKIGRLVNVNFTLDATVSIAAAAGNFLVTNLPFTIATNNPVGIAVNATPNASAALLGFGTNIVPAAAIAATTGIRCSMTYAV
jgi:hypothetical protein